ncbi:hypothetical protein HAX54_025299 [Datura stramonium]|uniref:Uncharacterized protein n=1 Tax=Datura stramonium TaxID=4076 RepID=A0ABS8V1D1_DATST|nr:hypothetical protein [Datura stramonium]
MECVNETCDRCKKDCGLLIHGKRVISFFKVMIEERCLEVLGCPEFLSKHDVDVEVKPLAEGTSSSFKCGNANKINLGSLTKSLLPKFEARITANDDMVSKPAEDIPLLGSKDKKFKEASQFREEYANNNEKVIRSESADSEDSPSLDAVN